MNPNSLFGTFQVARSGREHNRSIRIARQLVHWLDDGGCEPDSWANSYLGNRRRASFYLFCREHRISAN